MIGYLYVECMIYDVQSLKSKRSVVKQTVHSIQNRYNVSMTEIDYHDIWQRAAFGIATVSTDKVMAEKILQDVLAQIEGRTDLEVTIIEYEWL